MGRGEDAQDPYLPLMIWYGVEPLVNADNAAALKLAAGAKLSLIRRNIARRTLDVKSPSVERIVQAALRNTNEMVRLDLLHGMLDAGGTGVSAMPCFSYSISGSFDSPTHRVFSMPDVAPAKT